MLIFSYICYYIYSVLLIFKSLVMAFFGEITLFFLSLLFLLFLPGFFLIWAIFKKNLNHYFIPIEILVIAFATSLISFDFLIILIDKAGFDLRKSSILISLSVFILTAYALTRFSKNKKIKNLEKKSNLNFNKNQTILIILILFLTIFLKTVYLKDAIFPTATDLGHHMYWSKMISVTGQLPEYTKNEIINLDNSYTMQSEPIADFIIGEHLIFSGVNILTGIDFISYFPALILFLINIFSILAIFILALRLFEPLCNKNSNLINPVNLAILTLLLIGPLYAISSPQAKFVSGGVIGNLIGNLLIPLCLYFYFRAIKQKNSWMLFLGLFLSAGIFYTHHLSGFIFIFIFIFTIIFFISIFTLKTIFSKNTNRLKSLLYNYKNLIQDLRPVVLSPQVIIFIIATLLFLFFIYTPSYITTNAQTTVVGAPSKSTRAGLTWDQFKYATGELRLIFGVFGLIASLIIIFINKKSSKNEAILATSVLFGWSISIFLMTTKPHWLHINIPSDRIANYANFPFLIASSLGILGLFYFYTKLKTNSILSIKSANYFFILVFLTLTFQGFYDNSQSLSDDSKNQKALQTFHASKFLSDQMASHNLYSTNVLKDHNYISADSWIKLFFMQDYNYPISRGFFKRYEDVTKPREMCTLWMISEPSSKRSQDCFSGTQTKFIIVDTTVDGPQFQANSDFSKIYESTSLSIFSKNDQ